MIRSLELVNFRRHDKTRLDFPEDSQIVAITGRNGAGKTTVLEAIQFALYGQTRHGRKGVAGLVRRGAEHEGLGITLEFEVAGTLYRIERRWEKGNHTAALYANDIPRATSDAGVTTAVTDVLGMDAKGFKLATIANQKELDGLTELTPTVRRKTIARLLRLDAVQAAMLKARDQQNQAKAGADALAGSATVTAREAELADATQAAEEADAALAQARAGLSEVEQQLGAGTEVDAAYHAAHLTATRAEATRDAARAEHSRLAAELAGHHVPDPVAAPARPVNRIRADLVEVDSLISRGQAQAGLATTLEATRRRQADATVRAEMLAAQLDADPVPDIQARLAAAHATVADTATQKTAAAAELERVLADLSGARTRLADTQKRLATTLELGATCEECGQDVPESHKHDQVALLQARVAELAAARDQLSVRAEELRGTIAELDARTGRLTAEERQLTATLTAAEQTTATLADLRRSIDVYADDIARLQAQVETIDLPAAYQRKTELEGERCDAEAAEQAAAVRAAALTKHADLEVKTDAAARRLAEAEQALADAAPDPQLVAAWQERQKLLAAREAELEFVTVCATAAASAAARVDTANRLLEEARRTAGRIGEYRTRAEVAAKTATLLDAVARKMATQIRPQLEGQISAMLQLMSEGRFSSVKVSDDYEISVCDYDGRFYPVAEFSGGESDLIALAVRLALAQVVSARHGAGGAGFLILDEVFGSQDEGRRGAILEALRRLRGTYGQILLISHVGGIEDAADLVLEVARDDEDEVARVAVLT